MMAIHLLEYEITVGSICDLRGHRELTFVVMEWVRVKTRNDVLLQESERDIMICQHTLLH